MLRELLAVILPSDTPLYYMVSIVVAYSFGIVSSFVLQHRFTFGAVELHNKKLRMFRFFVVALTGAAITMALSAAIRYGLEFDRLFGAWGAMFSFVIAAVCASAASYFMSARYVFVAPTKY